MRVKAQIASGLLRHGNLHPDWSKIWFQVPADAKVIADVLAALFDFIGWPAPTLPPVKILCDGFFVATSAPVTILREGDCLSIIPYEDGQTKPSVCPSTPATACVDGAPNSQPPPAQGVEQTERGVGDSLGDQAPAAEKSGPSRNARRKKRKRQLRRQGLYNSAGPARAAANRERPQRAEKALLGADDRQRKRQRADAADGPSGAAVMESPRQANAALVDPQKAGGPKSKANALRSARALAPETDDDESASSEDSSEEESSSEDEDSVDEGEEGGGASDAHHQPKHPAQQRAPQPGAAVNGDGGAAISGSGGSDESEEESSDDEEQDDAAPRQEAPVRAPLVRGGPARVRSGHKPEGNAGAPPGQGVIAKIAGDGSAAAALDDADEQSEDDLVPLMQRITPDERRSRQQAKYNELPPIDLKAAQPFAVDDVIVYKASELGPGRSPSVSGWRLGCVTSVSSDSSGRRVVLRPWPNPHEHPMLEDWHEFCRDREARLDKQLRERGDWNGKERRTPEELEAEKEEYLCSSHAYDADSGVFTGDWRVDMACARMYRPSKPAVLSSEALGTRSAEPATTVAADAGPLTPAGAAQAHAQVGGQPATESGRVTPQSNGVQPPRVASAAARTAPPPQHSSDPPSSGGRINGGAAPPAPGPPVVKVTSKAWLEMLKQTEAKKAALAASQSRANCGAASSATQHQQSAQQKAASDVTTRGVTKPRGGARRTALGPVLKLLRQENVDPE